MGKKYGNTDSSNPKTIKNSQKRGFFARTNADGSKRYGERGNVFFTLFGAVAVVGVLGAGIMATMRGPLSTMVEVNRREQAKAELRVAASLTLVTAANTGNDVEQDCESGTDDGYVEGPQPGGALTGSIAGNDFVGALPAIGTSQNDPWGNPIGYCAWDHGPNANPVDYSGCGNIFAGSSSTNNIAIALISSGPDGTFDTTCGAHGAGYVTPNNGGSGGGDDILITMTYDQAISGSGGLWTLNAVDSNIAEIGKNIDVGGTSTFRDALALTGANAQLQLGERSMTLPVDGALNGAACNASNDGLIRLNTSTPQYRVEVCHNGTGWVGAGSPWSYNLSTDEIFYNAANVGIGTNDPDRNLDVTGTARVTSTLDVGGALDVDGAADIAGALDIGGDVTVGSSVFSVASGTGNTLVQGTLTANGDTVIRGDANAGNSDALSVRNSDDSIIFTVQNDTMVGINKGEPTEELDVVGDVAASGTYMMDGVVMLNNENITTNILLGPVASNAPGTTSNYMNLGDAIHADLANKRVGIGFGDSYNPTLLNDTLEVNGSADINGALNITGKGDFGGDVDIVGDIRTDGIFVNWDGTDPDTGDDLIPINCGDSQKLEWDDGWSCEDEYSGGSGSGGVPSLDDVLDTGNDGGGNSVTNIANPVNAQDAATKAYVDAQISGGGDTIIDYDSDTSIEVDTAGAKDGSDNHIVFTNNGTERMRLASGGNFGVGVTDPSARLQVRDSLHIGDSGVSSGLLRFESTGGVNFNIAGGVAFSHNAGSAQTYRFFGENDDSFVRFAVGTQTTSTGSGPDSAALMADIQGALGATQYCDADGEDCFVASDVGEGIWAPDGTNDYIEYDDLLGGVRIGKVAGQPAPATDWYLDIATSVVYTTANKVGIGTSVISDGSGSGGQDLSMDVAGAVGAVNFCDENGLNCFTASGIASGGAGLWTDNTTYITYDTAHVINTGETMPAAVESASTKMFWYPDKSAIRAGFTAGSQWSDANTGNFSAAFGRNNTASGYGAFSAGVNNISSGDRSTSFGSSAGATGEYAVAIGTSSRASGIGSIALGNEVRAEGTQNTMAIGLADQSDTDGTRPQVTGEGSLGIFMDTADNYDLSDTDTFALVGGHMMFDDDGSSPLTRGCVRFDDTAGKLQFSHDCSAYTDFGSGVAGNDMEVQFNDGGILAGDPDMTFDKTTDTFTVQGIINVGDKINITGQTGDAPTYTVLNDLGDVNTSGVSSGDILYYDGSNWVVQAATSSGIWKNDGPGGPGEIYYNTDNVGIGTNNPANPLHVSAAGNQELGMFDAASGWNAVAVQTGSADSAIVALANSTRQWNIDNLGTGDFTLSDITNGGTRPLRIEGTAPSDAFVIKASGNTGFGTNIPATRVDVNGTLKLGDGGEVCSGGETLFPGAIRYNAGTDALEFCQDNAAAADAWTEIATTAATGLWSNDGPGGPTEIYYNANFVGIGTNDPLTALTIGGDSAVFDSDDSYGLGTLKGLTIQSGSDIASISHYDRDGDLVTTTDDRDTMILWGDNPNDSLIFVNGVGVGAEFNERMRLTGDGKLGIGTTTPQQTLQVNDGWTLEATNHITMGWNNYWDTVDSRVEFLGIGSGNRYAAQQYFNPDTGLFVLFNSTDTGDFGDPGTYVPSIATTATGSTAFGSTNVDGTLRVDVNGNIGAVEYCNEDGSACIDADILAGGGVSELDDLSDAYTIYDGGTTSNMIMGRAGASALTAGAIHNLFIGENAGATTANSTTDTDNNIAIGYAALRDLTSGDRNVAVGPWAMSLNTDGRLNTAFGYNALKDNVSNDRSTAIGYEAMRYANDTTTGIDTNNTAVGYQALYGSTTSSANTGTSNTAIGSDTLLDNTSGSNNVALGVSAGSSNTTGNNNTYIGQNSAPSNDSSQNVIVGFQAGMNSLTAFNNTYLGYQAGVANTTGDNNIMIGSGTNAPTNSTNDFLNIGNTIYADLSTDRVGIGTNAPNAALHAVSDVATSAVMEAYSNTGIIGPTYTMGRGRGTTASPLIVNNLDVLGSHLVFGYDGDSDEQASSIVTYVDGTPADGDMPAGMLFKVRAPGSALVSTKMNIESEGDIRMDTNTGALVLHSGTTAQRPGSDSRTDVNGMIRYNTTTNKFEAYENSAWTDMIGTGSGTPAGADREIQFNNSGSFGASSGFTLTADDRLVLEAAKTGVENIFITGGPTTDTPGNWNVVIGNNAMNKIDGTCGVGSECDANVAIGVNAGRDSNLGYRNTWTGYAAGKAITDGFDNVGVGYSALENNLLGRYHTAIGSFAMEAFVGAATDTGNVAVGKSALRGAAGGLFTGDDNVAVGANAGENMEAGESNVMMGTVAGGSITDGDSNVAIGTSAGRYNETGSNNIFMGRNAGAGTAAGASDVNQNVIIGFSSAIGIQSGAAGNTIMGASAATNLTDGSSNVLLGQNAGDILTTGDSNIIIGDNVDAPTAATSSYLNLGNVIFGDMSSNEVMLMTKASAPVDADYANSSWSLWLDEVNDEFELKGKKSDGSIITQTVGASGGSSVWTDNTTYISYGNAHFTKVGEAPDASLDDNGKRFFFSQGSAALRGGEIIGGNTAWATANVGANSIAWGLNSRATGYASTAFGDIAQATNNQAFAAGYHPIASGLRSVAMGSSPIASGSRGVAIGTNVVSSGYKAAAFGNEVRVGDGTASDGTSPGTGLGDYSMGIGLGQPTATAPQVTGDSSLGIFMGDQDSYDLTSSNTFAVIGGDMLIEGTHTGTASVPVSGAGTRMFFDVETGAFRAGNVSGALWNNANIGDYSFAAGLDAQASGTGSIALGRYNTASAGDSIALGNGTVAGGYASLAMGWKARATTSNNSMAIGTEVNTTSGHSLAIGLGDSSGAGTGNYPTVSASNSLGVFLGDQVDQDLSDANTVAFLGATGGFGIGTLTPETALDVAGTIKLGDGGETCSGGETAFPGAIRYNSATDTVEFCKDNAASADAWTDLAGGGGGGALNDLTDAYTDYATNDNMAIGQNAGTSLTTGQFNLFIGEGSGEDTTESSYNVSIGHLSTSTNVAKSNITAIGSEAMRYANDNGTASGAYNTAVGAQALRGSTTASNNTGTNNAAFGGLTLRGNTSGSNNTALGDQSMFYNTTGYQNTAVGSLALHANRANRDSTAVGYHAMRYADSTTSGSNTYNTALGSLALRGSSTAANNTGTSNTSIGAYTMSNNTTGSLNVVVGDQTMYQNTVGNQNIAIGSNVLAQNRATSGNVAIGYRSMYQGNNTTTPTTTYNTAIGYQAMRGGSTPADNTGTYNTTLGSSTLLNFTSGSFNLALGSSAGSALTTGSNNVFLGYAAGDATTEGASNILIGSGVDAPTGTTDSYLNIGSVVYGDMASREVIFGAPAAAPADADMNNSSWSLWLDEANDEFELKARKADGSYISQTVGAGGGSGLWTDNTTYISYDNVHIIETGQTLPAALTDLEDQPRMFFHNDKAALRAGDLVSPSDADNWNEGNIGANSVAFGVNTQASGAGSFAMGLSTTASNIYATALGDGSIASGSRSFAVGDYAIAAGASSIAMGDLPIANGDNSIALGERARATGASTFAISLSTQDNTEGTRPQVSGAGSMGIFMDQTDSYNLSATDTFGIIGGEIMLDDDGSSAATKGCIRFDDTAGKLQFSNDCSTYSDLGSTVAGADTQVIFNDGGAYAGDAGMTFNKTTDVLTVGELNATDRISLGVKTSIGTPTGMAIDDLSDVNITSASNGECLTYDGSEWVDGACGGGSSVWLDGVDANDIYYSAGFVGIGTNDPDTDLEVVNAATDVLVHLDAPATNKATLRMGAGINTFRIEVDDATDLVQINGDSGDSLDMVLNASGLTNQLFLEKSTGHVGIGLADPDANLDVSGIIRSDEKLIVRRDGSSAALELFSYRDAANHSKINIRGARGTEASEALLNANDLPGSINFEAWTTGSTYGESASLEVVAPVNHSATSTPGELHFRTTPAGSTSDSLRMTIDSTGLVDIAGTLKIGNGGETCADGAEGMLRYNSGTDTIEFCEDNTGTEQWTDLAAGGGGGTPGGIDTQVQFNDGGAFGGDAGMVFNKTTDVLTVGELNATDRISLVSKTSIGTPTYPSAGGGASEINDLSDGYTADQNTLLGYVTLRTATSSDTRNVSIGYDALGSMDGSGSQDNIAIGNDALGSNTDGDYNVAIGGGALENSDSSQNIAIGERALNASSSGGYNTAIGYGSMVVATTGENNVTLGQQTLYNSTTGDANTVIGFEASGNFSAANGDMDGNTIIGYQSGHNLAGGASGAGANYNTFLGYQAGDATTTGDYNIMIGHGTDAPAATDSNKLNIGNKITGDLTSTGSVVIEGTAALQVPAGTTAQAPSPVNGMIRYDSTLDKFRGVVSGAWADLGGGASLWTDNTTHITRTGDILVDGTYTSTASVPATGNGTRMFFDVTSAAFRAGGVNGTQWDNGNLGLASFAVGLSNTASGAASAAVGGGNIASGDYAFVAGYDTDATGTYSAAFGWENVAGGGASFASGYQSTTSSDFSFAAGYNNDAIGTGANVAIGGNNTASGATYTVAIGDNNTSSGTASVAIGASNNASNTASVALGAANLVSGYSSVALGGGNSATGTSSVAIGQEVRALGTQHTMAIGLAEQSNTTSQQPQVSGEGSLGIFMDTSTNYNLSTTDTFGIIGGELMIDSDPGTASSKGCIRFDDSTDKLQFSHDCSSYSDIGSGGGGGLWTSGSGNDIYYNTGTPQVGIGMTNPDVALDVTGDIEYTGTLTDVSDRRLKTDIKPLNENGSILAKIDAIDTYSFKMKDDEAGITEFGVMAQELEVIFPELVKTADDEMGTKSVNYVGLIAPIIEASKELKAENETLKSELAAIKQDRDNIHNAVADLSKQVELLNKAAGNNVDKASVSGWMILSIVLMFGFSSVLFVFGGMIRRQNHNTDNA